MIAQHAEVLAAPHSRTVTFIIPGRIGGKGRHRSWVQKGKIIHTTPPETASQEAMVRTLAHVAMGARPLLEGTLRLQVRVWRIPPKSWSMKRRTEQQYITGKPDLSNQIKLLEDAMNGVVYRDDSQIAAIGAVRLFREAQECIEIEVTELEGIA